jgi:peptide/nickel transport system permease protein
MRLGYVVRRIAMFIVVLWGAATLDFFIPRLSPNDPVRERLYEMAAQGGYLQQGIEDMVKAYDQEFGLDQPIAIQYVRYLWDVLHLNFGYSLAQYPTQVVPMVVASLPWTIGLLLMATVLAFSFGTILGALIAWPKSPQMLRYLIGPLLVLSAIPYYLLGLVLLYVFAVLQPFFPLSGGYAIGSIPMLSLSFILDIAWHAILPALSIILAAAGFWALGMRGMMVTTEGEDYMTMAEAKGLPWGWIFYRYALRNAILPQVTALAIALGHIVSGSVLVEAVFGYPGIGSLLFKAISASDYFVIYGIVFIVILAIALATLIIDLIYPLLDPRITYRGA